MVMLLCFFVMSCSIVPAKAMDFPPRNAPIPGLQDYAHHHTSSQCFRGSSSFCKAIASSEKEFWFEMLQHAKAQMLILLYYFAAVQTDLIEDRGKFWDVSFNNIAKYHWLDPIVRRCLDHLDCITRLEIMPDHISINIRNTVLQCFFDSILMLSCYLNLDGIAIVDQHFFNRARRMSECNKNVFVAFEAAIEAHFFCEFVIFNSVCIKKLIDIIPRSYVMLPGVRDAIAEYLPRCSFLHPEKILVTAYEVYYETSSGYFRSRSQEAFECLYANMKNYNLINSNEDFELVPFHKPVKTS